MSDLSLDLQQQVLASIHDGVPLHIRAGNSKAFLSGHSPASRDLDVSAQRGIIEYDPRELVLTARSGTPLVELETVLAEAGQMLAFEPPHFGAGATLGGTIACGLSGPRRPHSGAARDFVLGCKLLNGRGEILRFGGQVMKNVAGYDVSRLMTGAHGTLGVLLEVSLKVLPRPAASVTLSHECSASEAISYMSSLLALPYPVDGVCYDGEHCHVRISGSAQAVQDARNKIPGEVWPNAERYWEKLREHTLPFFQHHGTLYRVMVKPATLPLPIKGSWLLDWGGAQRWLYSDEDLATIRHQVALVGGHVSVFRGPATARFQPLPTAALNLHRRIKAGFDPHNLFNRGALYAQL